MIVADNRMSEALRRDLACLVEDDAPLAWWCRNIELGAFSVLAVYVDGERVGSAIWRLDNHGGRPCFVILGGAGNHPKFDLMGAVLPEIEAYSKRLGCELVRFHTRRPGLVARGHAFGFGATEYVLLKEVA